MRAITTRVSGTHSQVQCDGGGENERGFVAASTRYRATRLFREALFLVALLWKLPGMSSRHVSRGLGGYGADTDDHRNQARLRQLRAELEALESTRGVSSCCLGCCVYDLLWFCPVLAALNACAGELVAVQRTHDSQRCGRGHRAADPAAIRPLRTCKADPRLCVSQCPIC